MVLRFVEVGTGDPPPLKRKIPTLSRFVRFFCSKSISSQSTYMHFIISYISASHYITLHYIIYQCVTLHYIILQHYIASHYIKLHHITSHFITSFLGRLKLNFWPIPGHFRNCEIMDSWNFGADLIQLHGNSNLNFPFDQAHRLREGVKKNVPL